MRVYRLEGPDGKGPYNGGYHGETEFEDELYALKSKLFWNCDIVTHPNPWNDSLLQDHVIQTHDLFGFEKMTHLYRWFGGFVGPFLKYGYHIAVYEVPKRSVKIGARQVAFNAKQAIKIK